MGRLTWARWTTDGLLLLAACWVSGVIGGLLGAWADRRWIRAT